MEAMDVSDALTTATIILFCIIALVAPVLFVMRAFRASDALMRAWLIAGALGTILLPLFMLETAAHTVAVTSAWIAKPLASYAAATAWLDTSVVLVLWGVLSLTLVIHGLVGLAASRGPRRRNETR